VLTGGLSKSFIDSGSKEGALTTWQHCLIFYLVLPQPITVLRLTPFLRFIHVGGLKSDVENLISLVLIPVISELYLNPIAD
jgi:hypothetical protein